MRTVKGTETSRLSKLNLPSSSTTIEHSEDYSHCAARIRMEHEARLGEENLTALWRSICGSSQERASVPRSNFESRLSMDGSGASGNGGSRKDDYEGVEE
eukprot:TCALIF_03828-PA protein Name:"Protein of unknown function" AED:0.93 eAED:1.00 QI:0/-1/0/1/-1/1/1/0/99